METRNTKNLVTIAGLLLLGVESALPITPGPFTFNAFRLGDSLWESDGGASVSNSITLEGVVKRRGGNRFVVLTWSPSDGGSVNVLRNNVLIATTDDDGGAHDNLGISRGVYTYQVCETDTGNCSNAVACGTDTGNCF